MSKKIGCDICYQPLGEIATGSKLKKGMKTVCEGCYGLVKMEISKGMKKKPENQFSDLFGKTFFE